MLKFYKELKAKKNTFKKTETAHTDTHTQKKKKNTIQ